MGTDFGEGSLTTSGYPRIVKIWKRGTPLGEAKTLYEAPSTPCGAGAPASAPLQATSTSLTDTITFWKSHFFQILDGKLERLDLPETADVEGGYKGRLVISLKEEWNAGDATYPSGSVLLADPAALRGGDGSVDVLVRPTSSEVVEEVDPMPQGIIVTMLDNVRGRLYRYQTDADDGSARGDSLPRQRCAQHYQHER